MNQRAISRRQLALGLGASAAALPFLRSFPASADGRPLAKVVFFASPTGFLVGPSGGSGVEGWLPSAMRGREMDVPARLPEVFSPLEEHKRDILFLGELRGIRGVGSHQQAVCMLTGRKVYRNEPERSAGGDGDFNGDGESIDQLLARRLQVAPLGLSFRTNGFQLGEGRMSFTEANRPFTPIQSIADAFDRVSGGGSAMPGLDVRLARRESVLDRVAGDIRAIEGRVSMADRERLQSHLESVRTLEQQIGMPSAGCGAGEPGSYDSTSHENIPRLIRDYNQVMVHALACGFTRVGFVQLGNLEGSLRPRWSADYGLDANFTDHAISHKFAGRTGAGSDGLSEARARDLGVQLQVAYNDLFADLLTRLRETPDVDGSPLLDNTVVVHVKPQGQNHSTSNIMWLVAGGKNLGIRGGRFLRVDGRHHNDFHVALAQTVGLSDVTSFGRGDHNTAPLELG
ncbi:MAG: DUF1552 domain-containing protein [Myxococcota bacterium]